MGRFFMKTQSQAEIIQLDPEIQKTNLKFYYNWLSENEDKIPNAINIKIPSENANHIMISLQVPYNWKIGKYATPISLNQSNHDFANELVAIYENYRRLLCKFQEMAKKEGWDNDQ